MSACGNGVQTGRGIILEIALICSQTPPADYLVIGGSRGLDIEETIDSIDVSNRAMAGADKEYIQTLRDRTISTDGVYDTSDSANLNTVRDYVSTNVSSSGNAEAPCWIRSQEPLIDGRTRVVEYPGFLNSFSFSGPYDAEQTYSLEFQGSGLPTINYVPAP